VVFGLDALAGDVGVGVVVSGKVVIGDVTAVVNGGVVFIAVAAEAGGIGKDGGVGEGLPGTMCKLLYGTRICSICLRVFTLVLVASRAAVVSVMPRKIGEEDLR
jgi:hypothetical protein